ncbi:MAG TPA: LON peptidase substrate-binding domain-containing protein, partial [Thermoanaerobaculia bacterium]|nr:LON peptidase substrate-binding domain-containing protein [Thermoanaerobaculia bacterium]
MHPSKVLPVIPLRNAVLFPGVSFPIAAGRPGTLHAIETAMKSPDQLVFAVTQRQDLEAVTPELLHTVGTIATIGPIQRGVGGARLLLQGKARGIAMRIEEKEGRLEAIVVEAEEMAPLDST